MNYIILKVKIEIFLIVYIWVKYSLNYKFNGSSIL